MCDKAVDDSLATLKLILDWFVTTEMNKKIFPALYADENIFYFNEDYIIVLHIEDYIYRFVMSYLIVMKGVFII